MDKCDSLYTSQQLPTVHTYTLKIQAVILTDSLTVLFDTGIRMVVIRGLL